MPNIIQITDLAAPELDIYARLTQAQLRNRLEPEKGVFIAESPKVISRALDAGLRPLSLLMEERQITGPARQILERCGQAPVYTAPREVLESLTGYTLTRGVLCAFPRPVLPDPAQLCKNATRIAVLEGVVDSTNIGAIFRSAAALGIDAVLTTPLAVTPCAAGRCGSAWGLCSKYRGRRSATPPLTGPARAWSSCGSWVSVQLLWR